MQEKSIRFREKVDGNLRWLTITTLLLAIGVILRMVSPNIGGISLNWNILMYTMAIMLCRPTLGQGLGIGIVSGLVATMSSKAALPYANLISDPLAAFICAYIAKNHFFDFKFRKVNIEPAVLVFVTTFISGGTFVFITKVVLDIPIPVFLFVMLPTVLIVALFGLAAGQILYQPANTIFNSNINARQKDKYSLSNIHLFVPKGSFSVLTGVNGAGKTSLLLTIAGARMDYFDDIYDSEISINNISVLNTRQSDLNRKVGMVMDDYEGQLVTETIDDEIAFSLENAGMSPEKIIKRRAEVLQMVGLEGFEKRNISSLSGGQKQRLAIAVMLAMHAEILILDEPIAAIDPEGAIEIYRLLKEINKTYHTTILVAEHDLKYVADLADQLIVMDAGEMKFAGSVHDCLNYMHQEKIYPEAIPLRWKIYLEMGDTKC
ncbi:energy-coupling factor transport system ATP-binding protein [Propionispira arboris]|uniref:Energy-coupling factor transport system ATP-binding protein n=1 Tax=Propionispira arboris TaxID=84035 RepID=A0A1H6X8A3_9FIRM|nr:ABC transporter ATP-binding protein [Propionispira arboris]SEJ25348.1 energy-coupling factor transport system ATP-binding protein [Propionispira arboris]